MKHTYQITIEADEEDYFQAKEEVERMINISNYISLISEFENWLRDQIKYQGNDALEPVREKWFELKQEEGIPE